MIYIVFDTETTGLDIRHASLKEVCSISNNGDEVIQIGGLTLDSNLNPIKAFCHYCDCLKHASDGKAFKTHQLDLATIRRYVPNTYLEDVLVTYLPEFFEEDVVFIGYNVKFDINMVAQSIRNSSLEWGPFQNVKAKLPREGRWQLNVMDFLPRRMQLVSYETSLREARTKFYKEFQGRLPLETNCPELLSEHWQRAHHALYDSIQTYLLFKEQVWMKKIFGGGAGPVRL